MSQLLLKADATTADGKAKVPYIILGIAITSVGAGLLTTLDADTPTINWAAYMVFNGLGIGMAQQLPYTALQAVLEYIAYPSACGKPKLTI